MKIVAIPSIGTRHTPPDMWMCISHHVHTYVHTTAGMVNTNITNKADQPHMSHMSPLQPTMHRKCRGGPSSNWISHIPSHPMLRPGRAFTPMRARSQLPRVTPTELEGAVLCVFMLGSRPTRCKHLPDAQRSGMRRTGYVLKALSGG